MHTHALISGQKLLAGGWVKGNRNGNATENIANVEITIILRIAYTRQIHSC
jgi:hypothetical protein